MRFASKRACSLRDDFLIIYKLITIISCITTFLKMKIQRENNINLFQNLLDFSHFLQFLQINLQDFEKTSSSFLVTFWDTLKWCKQRHWSNTLVLLNKSVLLTHLQNLEGNVQVRQEEQAILVNPFMLITWSMIMLGKTRFYFWGRNLKISKYDRKIIWYHT